MKKNILIFGMIFSFALPLILASPTQITTSVIINTSVITQNITFNETALNDTSTIKNITFTAAGDQFVYATLPRNSTVTSAEWNITGYSLSWDTELQEISDISGDFTVTPHEGINPITENSTHYFVVAVDAYGNLDHIYIYNKTNMSQKYTWNPPSLLMYISGIDANDTDLFIFHNNSNAFINKFNVSHYTDAGNFLSSFTYTHNYYIPSFTGGMASNGTNIAVIISNSDDGIPPTYNQSLFIFDLDGSLIKHNFISINDRVHSLDFSGDNLYTLGATNNLYYKLDTDGTIIESGSVTSGDNYKAMSIDENQQNRTIFFNTNKRLILAGGLSNTNLTNFKIDVGNDDTNDYTVSELNTSISPKNIDLNTTAINNWLSSCSLDANGNCDLSVNISSDTEGIIEISYINITFDYNISYLSSKNDSSGNLFWNQTSNIIANSSYKKLYKIVSSNDKASVPINSIGYYHDNQSKSAGDSCWINETSYLVSDDGSGNMYCAFNFTINSGNYWTHHSITEESASVAVNFSESAYFQDSTETTIAGHMAYITSNITIENPSDTGETLNGTWSVSARTGWTGNTISGTFSLSDGNSEIQYTNQSKNNVITKTEVETIIDTNFTADLRAGCTGYANPSWYYWNTTLGINNTDASVNFSSINWTNELSGANYDYSQNISTETIASLESLNSVNVTSRLRTTSVEVSESVSVDTENSYEKDLTISTISGLDSAFLTNNYRNVKINVSINANFYNYRLYYWNGVAWELHTETASYNFSVSNGYAYFQHNMSTSTDYYAVTSETPVYQPEPETPSAGGGGFTTEPIIIIKTGNWTILHPSFYLIAGPGSETISYITLDNKANVDIETIELDCVPSTCRPGDKASCTNLCDYVTFGEEIIHITGRPYFQAYQIKPGQQGKIPFAINFTKEHIIKNNISEIGAGIYTFSITVTIEDITNPISVTVVALPGGEILGTGLSWLQKKTLVIPGKYPIYIDNWLILIIIIIGFIIAVVILVNYLKKRKRKRWWTRGD